nr:hypothetical protein [Tanacetum cinerariifolium]
LPSSWSGIALILKTKGGLKYISFDDLYNKLKFLKIDTKGYSSSSPTLSNAAFISTAGSSQGNLSYQESGNGGYGGYTTTLSASLGFSSSKGSSKSKCSVVDDVLYSFFANHEIDQQHVYEDLDQMNKDESEEYDLKHQMAMLSIKVHRLEKKHGRKIKFNGRENAQFDKKLVKCFNFKQMGHFSRECRAQGAQTSNSYQKYKSKEARKDRSDSKAMVVVDGSIDWDKQTKEGNTEPRSLENFGMVTGLEIASDADSEGEVVFANDVIPAGVSVSAGDVAAAVVSLHSETKFALMGLSTEVSFPVTCPLCCDSKYKLIEKDYQGQREQLNDCAVGLKAHKHAVKSELGIDDSKFSIFQTNSDELEGQPIYNRFASVDHMKVVPPPLTGNYMPPSNIPDIDESQMVYGKKATNSSKIQTNDDSISHSHDFVLFYFSDRSSKPSTNDFQTCDSSMECSRPNHSDHDFNDSIFRVFAPASESRHTIVIDCDRQEDFPSVCTSNCDLHEQRLAKRNAEGKDKLGKRPTGKPVHPNRPEPVSAG